MRTAVALLLMSGLFSVAAADDPVFARLVEDGKKQRTTTMADLKQEIAVEEAKAAAAKKGKVNPGQKAAITYSSKLPAKAGGVPVFTATFAKEKDKEAELKRLNDRIDDLTKRLDETTKAEWINPILSPGDIRVGQVGVVALPNGTPIQVKVAQIIDAKNAVIEIGPMTHWLTMDTTGLMAGKFVPLRQLVHAKGTRVVGGRDVVELEAYSPPTVKK